MVGAAIAAPVTECPTRGLCQTRRLAQPPHDVAVDQLARPQRVAPLGALNLESVPLVEPDRGHVVGVHLEFEAAQPEPVIGKIEKRPQHRSTVASADMIVMHDQEDLADMRPAPLAGQQPAMGHDLFGAGRVADHPDQQMILAAGRQALFEPRIGAEWQLQRAVPHAGQVRHRGQRRRVARLGRADGEEDVSFIRSGYRRARIAATEMRMPECYATRCVESQGFRSRPPFHRPRPHLYSTRSLVELWT